MSYRPLAQARRSLNPRWYRTPVPPARLRELSTRSDRQGWIQAGGHFSVFCLTGIVTFLTWAQGLWILFLIALFLHGTSASFFRGTAVHELGHRTVFKTRHLNQFFLYLFSLISWWNPFDYAASHTHHHRFTLHPDGDREVLLPVHPNVEKTFLLQMFTVNLLTQPGRTFGKGGLLWAIWLTLLDAFGLTPSTHIPANEWLDALHKDQPEQHRRSIWWSRFQLSFHGCVLMVSIATEWWVLVLIIITPSFIANGLSYFIGLTQHCGLAENVADFRKNTRSIRLPACLEFLYWHMNWHIEHHMYAGVPCYNLPLLAEEIKSDLPEPRTLRSAWREMLDTWQRQKTQPSYAFDTPLLGSANSKQQTATTAEEESLGGLAPKALE